MGLPPKSGGTFFKQVSHDCAKLEAEMRFLLLLVPVGIYYIYRTNLIDLLRNLPSSNDDFNF